MSKVLEINVAENTRSEREMNAAELQELAERQAKSAAAREAINETTKARSSALAKLLALGLTEAEIAALIGS